MNKIKLHMKKIIIIVVVIALGVFGYFKFFAKSTSQVQYQTATAEKGTLVTSVSASGDVTSGNSLPITTNATGVVTKVYVNNGESVIAGQKIAEIQLDQQSLQRQTSAQASYVSAQNALNSAQSKMYSLQAALFKANQTFMNGKGADSNASHSDPDWIQQNATWLQSEADYKNQAGAITQAQLSLSSAWTALSQYSPTILAPSAGTVANLSIAEGVVISGSTDVALHKLGVVNAQAGGVQATVNLSEIDVPKVKPGQKVTMTLDALSGKTFTGKVLVVDTNGTVSSGVTTYPAVIVFDSATEDIYPNMGVSVKIITSIEDNVILVPSAAVQNSSVQVMKNGKINSVDVEVGGSNDTQTEIISGVNEGDVLVTGTTSTVKRTTSTSVFGNTRIFGGPGR